MLIISNSIIIVKIKILLLLSLFLDFFLGHGRTPGFDKKNPLSRRLNKGFGDMYIYTSVLPSLPSRKLPHHRLSRFPGGLFIKSLSFNYKSGHALQFLFIGLHGSVRPGAINTIIL